MDGDLLLRWRSGARGEGGLEQACSTRIGVPVRRGLGLASQGLTAGQGGVTVAIEQHQWHPMADRYAGRDHAAERPREWRQQRGRRARHFPILLCFVGRRMPCRKLQRTFPSPSSHSPPSSHPHALHIDAHPSPPSSPNRLQPETPLDSRKQGPWPARTGTFWASEAWRPR